jgi:hypothetical protein
MSVIGEASAWSPGWVSSSRARLNLIARTSHRPQQRCQGGGAEPASTASTPRLPGWRVGLTTAILTGALIACEEEFASLSTTVAPDRLLTATSDVAKKILKRLS